jgi:nitroimidazol reductase NimA-like FMN-containing flavoprotein (pyridoxamine 5'-phosphate oxidase superfamily)
LGLAKDNSPYIVPVSFGYDGDAIYFHTTKKERNWIKSMQIMRYVSNLSVEFKYCPMRAALVIGHSHFKP